VKKTNVLNNNKGFTMIEMLVVIILIGFVVSFLFNYAGNAFSNASSQQAASKIADDMRTISEAASRFTMEKATQATGFGTGATQLSAVSVQSGSPFLSSLPNPPTSGTTSGIAYTWGTTDTAFGGTGNDAVVSLTGIASKEVCQQINSQFAGAASGSATAIPAAITYTQDIQCYGAAGAYIAAKPIYIN
jgi:prepilin-type N-terminal cleavage/methylation domain-containing protein